jgi:hypothetical protein
MRRTDWPIGRLADFGGLPGAFVLGAARFRAAFGRGAFGESAIAV